MSASPASEVWARRTDVLWRRSGDVVVLLPPGSDDLVTLSSTGQALWEALAEPASGEEVARRLAARYGVPPETVLSDVLPTLADLERRRVVERGAA